MGSHTAAQHVQRPRGTCVMLRWGKGMGCSRNRVCSGGKVEDDVGKKVSFPVF